MSHQDNLAFTFLAMDIARAVNANTSHELPGNHTFASQELRSKEFLGWLSAELSHLCARGTYEVKIAPGGPLELIRHELILQIIKNGEVRGYVGCCVVRPGYRKSYKYIPA